MNKLDISKVAKLKPNPIFKGLPSRLKEPTTYLETEQKLRDVLQTDHTHKKPSDWYKCESCQAKFQEKRKLLKKLGFKSQLQFLEWRKVMTIITNQKDFQIQ